MRALFLFLVLANTAFFAWSRYLAPADAVTDTAPLTRQIQPEKLRIMGPGEQPSAAAKPAAAPLLVAAAGGAPAAACLEWGSFTLADAPRAEKALEPLALGAQLSQRRTEEVAGWWVYIPPQAGGPGARQAALKKAAELKTLKVDEYFIVAEDVPQRWAISLGVFRSAESANARLAALKERGVRSAQVGPRETVVPKIWLQVRSVDTALDARLRDVARQIDGSEVRPCS